MKIGILTLPLHTNYGGILQAYALQTVLERMGHEVSLIHGFPNVKRRNLYRKIRHALSPIKRFVVHHLVPDHYSKNSGRYTSKFIAKWIKRDNFQSTDSIPFDYYDAIVVGSDQIWRKIYVEKSKFLNHIETSFLDFAKCWNIKKISYAASFGTDEWEYDEESTKRCSKLIRKFDAVSVREASGVTLCNKYLHNDAVQLLDPTLLLSKEDYLKLIKKRYRKNSGIMTYILDEDDTKLSLVEEIMKKTGKAVFRSNVSYNKPDSQVRGAIQPPLEKWLQSFEDADMIITDSFHACVFSIIFNKPFIAIPNMERGASRFYSLLKMVNQEYRIVDTSKPLVLDDVLLSKPDCDLSQYQKISISFLQKNLK